MEGRKPYWVMLGLLSPIIYIFLTLDTPEAAGARAGFVIAFGLVVFFAGVSFIADLFRKGGR